MVTDLLTHAVVPWVRHEVKGEAISANESCYSSVDMKADCQGVAIWMVSLGGQHLK